MNNSKQIKLGAVLSYLSVGINIIIGIVYTPWMISKIGQNDYGLFTLATSVITMFVMDFGMGSAVTRFLSKYYSEGDRQGADNFLGLIYKLYLCIDLLILTVLLIVYFSIDKIYVKLTPVELERFKIIFIIIASFSVISFPFTNLNGILTANEKFVQLKLCDFFNKIFTVLSMIVALSLGYGLYALVVVNTLAGILTIILKLIIIRKTTFLHINLKYRSKNILKEIFGFSVWSTIGSLAQRFIISIIPTVLGAVSGSKEIAVFGVAQTIEGYVYTFAEAINGMFLPKITRIVRKNGGTDNKELLSLMIKIGKIQACVIGLIFTAFLTLGKSFIVDIWIGSNYEKSYICALFIIAHYIIMMPQQIANTAVIVQNKIKYRSVVIIIMCLINVPLSFLLSKRFGAEGAAVSIFTVNMVCLAGLNIIYKKILKIDIKTFFKQVYSKQLLVYLLSVAAGFLLNSIDFIGARQIKFFINAVLFVLIYVMLEYLICLSAGERKRIKNGLLKYLKRG